MPRNGIELGRALPRRTVAPVAGRRSMMLRRAAGGWHRARPDERLNLEPKAKESVS